MTSRQLLFVLLGVFAITQLVISEDQEGFISLDCGLSADEPPYTDSSNKLRFSSDAKFVEGGKSGTIQKHLEADYLKAYTTLRYFPDGIRNCYNLNVTQDTRYLVRASFVYGNYNGLDSHPIFDLYIGRSWWATISNDLEDPNNKWTSLQSLERGYGMSEEIIHTAIFNTLQVCLVKTDATVPFISALELRPLSDNVYATRNGSLKRFARVYFSNTNSSIRYPDDVHDRTWIPFYSDDMTMINNNNVSIENSNPFDPPQAAIRTAARPTNASSPLILFWTTSDSTDQFYIYIHFLELQVLRANEARIFAIFFNGNITSQAYSPSKSMIDTVYNNVPLSCSNDSMCSLELRKTPRSTLPPLINAIEIFRVLEIIEAVTDENDVLAIKNIRAAYALSNESRDPCVPKPSHYLNCSNSMDTSEPMKIISLNLSSKGLSGIISPTIQNLTKLQVLNKLTGGVPEFLFQMASLLFIDLSNNSLSGLVPQYTGKEGLVVILRGNPNLYNISSSKKKFPVAVVASVASIVICLVVLVVLYIGLRRKWSSREALRPSIETAKRRFTYSEVMGMTNNFQKILGEGGFGIIYHGHLDDIQQVAVKVLSQSSSQGYKQFKAEVELLMRVHHINLVNLAGYCDERDHLALVYEYMENRDLKEHLSEGSSILDWPCRLRIAAEAALGLEYLHTGCKPPMIHRDVKSTNILLNEDFQAKLGDFGLSRSFPVGSETHVSTVVVGTPGFLDPEYFQTHRLSEKSDVYSFGIVLLEVITNQLVIDQTRERPHIAEWVRYMLSTGDIESIMDPNLKGSYESSSAWKALELAMSCCIPSSAERPNMAQIVHELNECLMYENSKRGKSQDVSSKTPTEVSTSTQMAPMAR
ncbi:probable LRR receptor-like serine/threonine-protein kinase PAM74 isoform X2 [Eutrema salsugineum]|uniref:probable LRR receptor-like serine/threonine-protein kinase PAM74 isoform X2 n=1 Tax=Eutrema salsugineum TaxID=72664 RepID=UPI000CECEF4E|nr:probable LRR receptor-like serine/threonine-protein kinase PAM74 isoform X2 [Eutrema salsugineum]